MRNRKAIWLRVIPKLEELDRQSWDDVKESITSIETFFNSVHPDDRSTVERKVAAALDPADDGNYEAEFRIKRGDGAQRWVVCRGRALFATQAGERGTDAVYIKSGIRRAWQ